MSPRARAERPSAAAEPATRGRTTLLVATREGGPWFRNVDERDEIRRHVEGAVDGGEAKQLSRRPGRATWCT